MTRRAVFHDTGSFDDGSPITSFPGAVSSVFGRTGAVAAAAGDYYGAVPAALTGATQASRFTGATVSGAPVSGTFAVGDHVLSLADGKWYVCTVAGTPGTWVTPASGTGVTYGTPAVVLGTAAAAGSTDEAIRRDSTIVAFDTTAPSTQAFGDAAATGSAAVAARRDHVHGMPAAPTGSGAKLYDYEISGSDKASIDTNVDGTTVANFSGYNVLDIYFQGRTDEAVALSTALVTLNNDGSALYDLQETGSHTSSAVASNNQAQTAWTFLCDGASAAANYATLLRLEVLFPNGTTFTKQGRAFTVLPNTSATNYYALFDALNYRNTAAITRIKFAAPGSQKFKVGTRLVVYGR